MIKGKQSWDFLARYYEKLWVQKHSLKPTRQLIRREIAKLADSDPHLLRGGKLLDMGCGTGQLLQELAEAYPPSRLELTGIDASPEMIRQAKAKQLSGVKFLAGDVHHLPFPDHTFEIITCCHSFPYYHNQSLALQELARIIKPKGHLLLIQAVENSFYDKIVMSMVKCTTGSANYLSSSQISKELKENGFTPLEEERLKTVFYFPSIVYTISTPGAEHENSLR
ncbi:class I SAM-dependent methyltransferase [Dehalobacterium formicoaceticum]|uniref:Methyltransferase domain-containing protein n=1 Tax=Dehalobacterium formicoaceticum TaxID=51515 RepID=A0ABT1Y1U2_9FIRM|nr:class I SAM-dependent methyltransferase [Dehalobacterium formicoaceticum]MCR6544815.1 methyltransferase domain-containing protein [Dehalobacterium formicoaceticum]